MKKKIPAKAMEERKKLMLQAINGPPHPSLFYWFVPKYSRPSTSDLRSRREQRNRDCQTKKHDNVVRQTSAQMNQTNKRSQKIVDVGVNFNG